MAKRRAHQSAPLWSLGTELVSIPSHILPSPPDVPLVERSLTSPISISCRRSSRLLGLWSLYSLVGLWWSPFSVGPLALDTAAGDRSHDDAERIPPPYMFCGRVSHVSCCGAGSVSALR